MDRYIYTILLLKLALYGLSAFRWTMFLYDEDGPFSFMDWLRSKFDVRIEKEVNLGEDGKWVTEENRYGEGFLGELFACSHCLSFWVCGFHMLLYFVTIKWLPILDVFIYWGAIWCLSYWLILLKEKS